MAYFTIIKYNLCNYYWRIVVAVASCCNQFGWRGASLSMRLIQINLCAGFLIKFQVHQVICCRIHNSKMRIFGISACSTAINCWVYIQLLQCLFIQLKLMDNLRALISMMEWFFLKLVSDFSQQEFVVFYLVFREYWIENYRVDIKFNVLN